MTRKNVNALRGGNAPRRNGTAGDSAREAWRRILGAVNGTARENVAQSAAYRADHTGHAPGSEPWAREAVSTYRALTA